MKLRVGSGLPNIQQESLRTIKLQVPPSASEQRAIAEVLSDANEMLATLDKLIEKKRAIKTGAMQQLLSGKKRLPGFSKSEKKFKKTEIGPVPADWEVKTIEELGCLSGAGVDKKSRPDEKRIRLVNYLDVLHKSKIWNRELDFWVTASDKKIEQCDVKKGDVFFTPSSEMPFDIAFSAVAMEDMPRVCYSYHIYRLRILEDIDLDFRVYLFDTRTFYRQAEFLCEGSGKRYVISLAKFRTMKIAFPPSVSEQRAIAEVLSSMDGEIEALLREREKYARIKQGMMRELLTGTTRLEVRQ